MKINSIGESYKYAFFLPNIFTALNMGCGFTSMILASQGKFYLSCMILLLGGIFDMVDGRVARLTGTQSAFGEQFDSLSDVITFGIAPAILVYARFLSGIGRIGMVVAFIYLLCGAMRLGRFNANINSNDPNNFQGLPIPGAAIAIVSYVLISSKAAFPAFGENAYIVAAYTVFYALLMISSMPFCSFKHSPFVSKHKRLTLVIIFFLLCSIFVYEEVMIGIIITAYVIGCMIYFFAHGGSVRQIFAWGGECDKFEDDEEPSA